MYVLYTVFTKYTKMSCTLMNATVRGDCLDFYIASGLAASLLVIVILQSIFLIICGVYLREKNLIIRRLQDASEEDGKGMVPIFSSSYVCHISA